MQPKTRTVPSPRPGELLIYDCRPPPSVWGSSSLETQSGAAGSGSTMENTRIRIDDHNDSSILLTAGPSISSSSPPTPTPACQDAKFNNNNDNTNPSSPHADQRIRCLQWNIERNYKPEEILATLTELDADILCIQEIDIGCRRSGHDRDHFLEICASQGLYGGFVPEFWELEDPARKDRDQGGGVHGNAILSRWPVNGFRVLDHVHHAYEWERDGHKLNEPRLGRRFTIVADIQTPSGPLLCYCAHLEVFTGIVGRISALSDILADADLYADRYPYQIIFGDLNTISHSIARLAKAISTDQYRIMSVGSHEAQWWDQNLWSWHVQDGEFNLALATGGWSWLRRFGILGLGTGANSTGVSFWSADSKYSGWLKRLVEAGLDKVRQARQDQLANDIFVNLEKSQEIQQTRSLGRLNKSSLSALESSLTGLKDARDDESSVAATIGSSEGGGRTATTGERGFHENVEGSMILVNRPRSYSINTLDSSLMDKSDYNYIRSANSTSTSSPTWSLPSTSSLMQFDREEEYEDDVQHVEDSGESHHLDPNDPHGITNTDSMEEDSARHPRHPRHPQVISPVAGSSFPTTPSTPSPTLRLIPPTPKRRRSKVVGFQGGVSEEGVEEEGPEGEEDEDGDDIQAEDRRGIVLQYGGDVEVRPLQQDIQEHIQFENQGEDDRRQQQQKQYTHQHNQRMQQCQQHSSNTHDQTAATYPNDETISRPFHDNDIYEFTTTTTTTNNKIISSTYSSFHDPQPPFLLSHFDDENDKAAVSFFARERLWSGFTPLVLHQARNPGFYDPWNSGKDLTLHNPAFLGLLAAKLDYTLLRNLRCESRAIGNHDYSASDHKWLLVEVVFEREFKTSTTITTSTSSEEKQESENTERKMPSKEQQYLWWRERRQQWGQPVQPLSLHLHHHYHHQQQRQQQQQQLEKEQVKGKGKDKKIRHSSSSLTTTSVVMATLTAVVAIGGYLWWTRGGK
ncbi:hypothetical protein BGZ83_000550 [Gryganskiella cystojenkinii]|nr:hypothetical protein BGZ83_000550 [Gryganskiella cystojenkinii]